MVKISSKAGRSISPVKKAGKIRWLALGVLAILHPIEASAQTAESYSFVTLGTQGGPVPSPERSQPANLLVRKGQAHLVDVGDNAVSRMVSAGAPMQWLRSIFISHIHFDHIGGLYAVLGLRHQLGIHTPLTVYGPPGTKAIVTALEAAMVPSAESGFGMPGERPVAPATGIDVVELSGGQSTTLPDFQVRTAENSHYSFPAGDPRAERYRSLSYRFEFPDRSIVYTGDTGPSDAVAELAKGADLLVTEMIDLDYVTAQMARMIVNQSPDEVSRLSAHLATHHLTSRQVADLAKKAGVGKIVVTHFAGDSSAGERYISEIHQSYAGPVIIATDLDRY